MPKKKKTPKIESTENTEEGKNEDTKLPTLNDIIRSDSIKYDEKEIENRKNIIKEYISNENNQFFPILDINGNEWFINRKILSKLNENKEQIKKEFPIKNHLNNEIKIKKEDITEDKDDNKKIGILVSNDDNNKYLIRMSTIKKYSKKLPEDSNVEFKDLSTNEKNTINLMKCNFEKIDIESQLNEFEQKLKEENKNEKNTELKEESDEEEEEEEEEKEDEIKEEKKDEIKEEKKDEIKDEIKEEKKEVKKESIINDDINTTLNVNEQLKIGNKKKEESKEITQEDLNLLRDFSNDKPIIIRRAVYRVSKN